MSYYQITNDLVGVEESWVLGDLVIEDIWKYSHPKEVETPDTIIIQKIHTPGHQLDFAINSSNTIIVSELAASIFNDKEVQKFPIKFYGLNTESRFFILSIKNALDCIDEEESNYEIWEDGNNIRPDKAGQYRSFFKMAVKDNLNTSLNIFRIKRYNTGIIVSDEIKRKFEILNLIGATFKKV